MSSRNRRQRAREQRSHDSDVRSKEIARIGLRCTVCGSGPAEIRFGVGFGQPNRICRNCSASWYITNCWSCPKGIVDSRTSNTCSLCNWYRCSCCGACRQPKLFEEPCELNRQNNDGTPFWNADHPDQGIELYELVDNDIPF
jgi:hypothetical protein